MWSDCIFGDTGANLTVQQVTDLFTQTYTIDDCYENLGQVVEQTQDCSSTYTILSSLNSFLRLSLIKIRAIFFYCLYSCLCYQAFMLGVLLNFIFGLKWGGVTILSLCAIGTYTEYKIENIFVSYYDEEEGETIDISSSTFPEYTKTTGLTYVSQDILDWTVNTGGDYGENLYSKQEYVVKFSIQDIDLKKLFDFTENSKTWNLIDCLISVFRESDD